jgi:hypothetical protein
MALHKTDGVDGRNNITVKKTVLYGTAAITRGDVVMIDTGDSTNGIGFSVKSADAADSPLAVGVALTTTTAAGNVEVQTSGLCELVTDSGGTLLAGEITGNDTTGEVRQLAAANNTTAPFAVCVRTYTINDDDGAIMIIDKGIYEG